MEKTLCSNLDYIFSNRIAAEQILDYAIKRKKHN